MASDYGLNFGFRRSDESLRVAEGRYRTPAAGALLQLGTAVTPDNSAAGFLKVASANAKPITGVTGLLLQEEIWDRTIYEAQIVDSFYLGIAKPNRLSVITNGAGTKVWFKNTAAQDRADGRHINAVNMFVTTGTDTDTTPLAVGVGLRWNGTAWDPVADPTASNCFAVVTFYDAAAALVEAVLTH